MPDPAYEVTVFTESEKNPLEEVKKQSFFSNFLERNKQKLKIAAAVLGVVVVVGAAYASYKYIYPLFKSGQAASFVSSITKPAPEPRNIPGPINGALYTASEAAVWQNRHPLSVIIENSVDARPQSGLSSADIVYEALAEGGITRQLAVYLTNLSSVSLGPVRSMRVYFLDWLEEYDALAAHVGGNDHALARIGPENVKNMDQFYTPGFVRTNDRAAPHNVYTNTDSLWNEAAKKGWTGMSTFHSWPFKDEASSSARPATQILSLGFLGDINYKISWTYNKVLNSYSKIVGGVPFIDRNTGQPITAKTIAVEVVPYTIFPDDHGALNMQDIGSGPAYIFEDGIVVKGTWSKASRTDRTLFLDSAGTEIPFNRGPIWVEVIPPNTPISY